VNGAHLSLIEKAYKMFIATTLINGR